MLLSWALQNNTKTIHIKLKMFVSNLPYGLRDQRVIAGVKGNKKCTS